MITTEVKSIHLHDMKNAKFVEFMNDVNNLLISKEPITTALKPLTDQFAELTEKLKLSVVAVRGNSFTEMLNSADEQRDKIHRGFIHLLNAYKSCNDPAKEAAATNLFFSAKQFGLSSLREAANDSETSLLDGLVESMKSDKHAQDIVTLPEVGTFMTALEAAIAKFKQVKNSKVSEQSEKITYTTYDIRGQIIPVYRRIIGAVEAMAEVGLEPAYGEFITELNAYIEVN